MIDKIGLQTFTIRNLIKTPVELENTLMQLSDMGIKTFELARIRFNENELKVLKKLKEDHGLQYSVCQIKLKDLEKKHDWYVEFCKALDIDYLEVSVIPMKSFLAKKRGFEALAQRLNQLGSVMKSHGIKLLYHHHHFEMIRFESTLGLDLLMEKTDKALVNYVLDTYWLARGGYDPVSFIDKRKDRVLGVHLRGFDLMHSGFGFKIKDANLAEGRINFEMLIQKAHSWPVDFYSIEQATTKPLQEIQRSYDYLKGIIS